MTSRLRSRRLRSLSSWWPFCRHIFPCWVHCSFSLLRVSVRPMLQCPEPIWCCVCFGSNSNKVHRNDIWLLRLDTTDKNCADAISYGSHNYRDDELISESISTIYILRAQISCHAHGGEMDFIPYTCVHRPHILTQLPYIRMMPVQINWEEETKTHTDSFNKIEFS